MLLGPGLHERGVDGKNDRRVYLAHVPQSCDPETRFPVVVVLHGGGGSAAFASRVYGWRELSHREGCLIVFPEAMCEDPAILPRFAKILGFGTTAARAAPWHVVMSMTSDICNEC